MGDIAVFTGHAHPHLAVEICTALGVPLQPSRLTRFANDCIEVELAGSCRHRDAFVIQPIVPPIQEGLVELLLMLDAARGASAERITAVIPHYAYARSDKKDARQISIGGRLVADLLVTAGAERILTMALHAAQVQGFFSVPVDHLYGLRELAAHCQQYDLEKAVVVSPDLGNAQSAATFARMLGLPVALGVKQRLGTDRVRISSVVGEIAGRDVVVLDDEIVSGRTVLELLRWLRELSARSVRIYCTHGLFTGDILTRLSDEPDVTEIVCTNTVPLPAQKRVPKLRIVSVARTFAQAIGRIHNGQSVSALFESSRTADRALGR